MAKKMEEQPIIEDIANFDTESTISIADEQLGLTEVELPKIDKKVKKEINSPITGSAIPVNCLRNERVIVRHIPKQSGMITNPKHILYGGMAENATKTFVVPVLSSGAFVNVLTDEEKAFLEEAMGLEYNALSIYKKPLSENFWSDSNEGGISRVRLLKQDNYFNLSNPEDYIRYKILLANKDFIAPSL